MGLFEPLAISHPETAAKEGIASNFHVIRFGGVPQREFDISICLGTGTRCGKNVSKGLLPAEHGFGKGCFEILA